MAAVAAAAAAAAAAAGHILANLCDDPEAAARREELVRSVDMSEMFSPERVASVCKKYGLVPRQALDLKNGYNFDLTADRKKAWDFIIRDEPTLIIGSPPCTFFSRLQ